MVKFRFREMFISKLYYEKLLAAIIRSTTNELLVLASCEVRASIVKLSFPQEKTACTRYVYENIYLHCSLMLDTTYVNKRSALHVQKLFSSTLVHILKYYGRIRIRGKG